MKNVIEFTDEELEISATNLEKIKKTGILVTESNFNAAVNGSDGTPEDGFSITSNKSTRRAKMWLLPNGFILCEQEGKHVMVPPTFKFAKLK